MGTAKGIGYGVTHLSEVGNALKEHYWGNRKTTTQKVVGVTEAICDIAFLAHGAKKGFDKLSKGAKARKAVKIAEGGEIAKAGEAGEIAEEAAKAGEIAEEAAKAGEVAEEAAKAGGKGKVKIESSSNFKGQIYKGTRNPEIDFVNGKGKSTLTKHAGKHGYASPEEYLKDARNFLEKQPTSTTQSFVSSEGTYFRYDTATNEFGIINQYGGISTYYKPEEGMIYWLEQIEKYAPK